MSTTSPLIITIKEARKILGTKYDHYSDDYVEELIKTFDGIAEYYFKTVPSS